MLSERAEEISETLVGTQLPLGAVLEDGETSKKFWDAITHGHDGDVRRYRPIFKCISCKFWFKRRDMSSHTDCQCKECGR